MNFVKRLDKCGLTTYVWRDADSPRQHKWVNIPGTVLHYASDPDGDIDSVVDMRPVHVTSNGRDLYYVSASGWLFGLGQNNDGALAGQDGVVMFGGRRGANRLDFRLVRCGYLHGPTRDWTDISGAPTYDRANLTRRNGIEVLDLEDVPTETIYTSILATWSDIWSGIDISWQADGRGIKELVTVSADTRNWIAANRPPTTPAAETWFGFVFRIDPINIPQWMINHVVQSIEGDFNDDAGNVELKDAEERLIALLPISCAFSERDEIGDYETIRLQKRIWKDGDNYYLLVGARVDRLNALRPGAITFDPTFDSQPGATGKDTWLKQTDSDANYGASGQLMTYEWSGASRRPLIEIDCSSIPGDATCDDATLYLYAVGPPSDSETLTIHSIASGNAAWQAGSQDGTTGGTGDCCWDYLDQDASPTSWAGSAGLSTSGTDYESTAIGTIAVVGDEVQGDEWSTTLTASRVEGWFGSSNTNYGIRIQGSTNRYVYICASEFTTSTYRPRLVVNYTEAGGTVSFSATIAASTTTPDDASLAVLRALSATIGTSTTTPDNAVLAVLRNFAAVIAASASTPDDAVLSVARDFAAVIAAGTTTPDDVALQVLRSFAATIAVGTSTPDDVALAVLRQFAATIAASTSTPDDVTLLTIAIVGLLHIVFTSRAPSTSFTSRQPSATFTSRRPSVTFTGRKD